ncbi:MAG TPA: NAD-binding protein [Egibacteraceae bacterium]|nr:NAD-binding protein [Egibacteraceae bacterium]
MAATTGRHGGAVALPSPPLRPARAVAKRLVIALGLVCLVTALVWFDRDSYIDDVDGAVGLLDAFYYATVTVTTTGYGDITPVTDRARLVTALLVTPARILFLIVLVGTTLELLTERWRQVTRLQRWRSTLNDHYIVCGYGAKGRSAIQTLMGQGIPQARIVVVDPSPRALTEAGHEGFATVNGDASRTTVLHEAGVENAAGVIVAVDRDDAAVLVTLTARECNRTATIVASVREGENAHLLREGGADSVITSAEASGRLLGLATRMPHVVGVMEDLLTVGQGLDVVERSPEDAEIGQPAVQRPGELVMAVVRDGQTLRFDAPEATVLQRGDRIVMLCARS